MTLDEFDDDAITRIVGNAMFWLKCPPHLRDDARQAGALHAIELRRRLRSNSPGCRILNRRNIGFCVFKAMKRSLARRVPQETYVESAETAPGGLDFTELAILKTRLRRLSSRERRLIRAHFYDGLSMVEIAGVEHVSKQRISILILRALKKMRAEPRTRRKPHHV